MNQEMDFFDVSKRNQTDFQIDPFQTQSLQDKIEAKKRERALKKNYDFADDEHFFGFFGLLLEEPQNSQPQVPNPLLPPGQPILQARRRRISKAQRRERDFIRNQQNNQNRINRQLPNQPRRRQTLREIRTITSRRFNTSPGLLISGIKDLCRNFVFDGMFVRDQNDYLITMECFEKIKEIIQKLSSRVGSKRQLRMIFNLNDPLLNQKIQNIARKTAAQQDFLDLLSEFGPFIVELAKFELKFLLHEAMSPDWMRDRAESRAFYDGVESPETRYRRREFHKYLQHFRMNLESDFGILETLNRRALAGQFEGEEEE